VDVKWLGLLELIKDRLFVAGLLNSFRTNHMLYKCNGKLK
jgi:hypothetical protein